MPEWIDWRQECRKLGTPFLQECNKCTLSRVFGNSGGMISGLTFTFKTQAVCHITDPKSDSERNAVGCNYWYAVWHIVVPCWLAIIGAVAGFKFSEWQDVRVSSRHRLDSKPVTPSSGDESHENHNL